MASAFANAAAASLHRICHSIVGSASVALCCYAFESPFGQGWRRLAAQQTFTPATLGAAGRAAMLGMLAAFGAELATKEPIAAQAQKAPLLIGATFVTIIIASVIPVFRGADLNQKGAGPFTPRA